MENPSLVPPAERKPVDLDALVRFARDERGLSENTLLAYQRAWQRLLAWTGAHRLDPLALTQEDATRFYREMVAATGRAAASSQVQARAALAFAYGYWDVPDPFARLKSPCTVPPPPADFLPAHDLARLLGHLGDRQATYGESLCFHLANTLFFTGARFSEIASLRWNDCLLDPVGRPVALRVRGKGGGHHNLPVNVTLGGLLARWRTLQDQHRGMKVFAARGLKFCRSEYVFAGPGGAPYTNRSFNNHLRLACRELRLPCMLTAHGLRRTTATILLHAQGKNLREVQDVLRHKDIRTTARGTRLAYEHTRPTLDARGENVPSRQANGRAATAGRKATTASEA